MSEDLKVVRILGPSVLRLMGHTAQLLAQEACVEGARPFNVKGMSFVVEYKDGGRFEIPTHELWAAAVKSLPDLLPDGS